MIIGKLITAGLIMRPTVKHNPDKLFMFGDNMTQQGMGGQAGEMRHEVNSIGIPTKWRPGMSNEDFFKDDDWANPLVRLRIAMPFELAAEWLSLGKDVVIPRDGFGTGLSELPKRAPKIYAKINKLILDLENTANRGAN